MEDDIHSKWWPILHNAQANTTLHAWLPEYCEHHMKLHNGEFKDSLPLAIKVGLGIDTGLELETCEVIVSTEPSQHTQCVRSRRMHHHGEEEDMLTQMGINMQAMVDSAVINEITHHINKLVSEKFEETGKQLIKVNMLVTPITASTHGEFIITEVSSKFEIEAFPKFKIYEDGKIELIM